MKVLNRLMRMSWAALSTMMDPNMMMGGQVPMGMPPMGMPMGDAMPAPPQMPQQGMFDPMMGGGMPGGMPGGVPGGMPGMMPDMGMAMPMGMPPMPPMSMPGQKRSREEGVMGQQSKVLAAGGVMMRIISGNQEAGTVIGTGGSNIREIRDTSGCHVNVAESLPGQPERLVSLTGTTEQVHKALSLVIQKLEEAHPTPQGEKRVCKVLIANEQIGSVIGKGGSRAKEIREQTNTFMNISATTEMHAYSPERIVTVTGEAQACLQALMRITEQLAEHPLEDRPTRAYGQEGAQRAFPGFAAQSNIQAVAPSGAPGGPECTGTFSVLNDHAGHLIGKGGSVINELRQQSGCKIDMSRGEPGMTERQMTLNGSIQQCMLAQHLISVKLASVLSQLKQFEERDRAAGYSF